MRRLILFLILSIFSLGFTEEKLYFPKDFLWGTATSEYQNSGEEGCPNSNWAAWEKCDSHGSSRIAKGDRSKNACAHWENFKEDIALMQKLGVNAYRFSIDWSVIEPKEGSFCMEALLHYKEEIKALKKAGITPMVTLHHYSHPSWFEEMKGFENEENIVFFERFCNFIFSHFKDDVDLWCTFNEPNLYSFTGYAIGRHPPGKQDWNLAATVLKNIFKAHIRIYKNLKSIKPEAKIGIVHNVLKTKSYTNWNPVELIAAKYVSKIVHDTFMEFFKTGIFNCYLPLASNVYYEDKEAPNSLDFVGVNYYSSPLVKMNYLALLTFNFTEVMQSTCFQGEVMSDAPFRLYPEGMYEAIKEVAALKHPIFITENGIADAKDDRRPIFIQRYLENVSKAVKEGFDVRGYFYWTLMDNFEWADGFNIEKYGLYEVDFKTKKRTLRPGAKTYIDIIANWKSQSLNKTADAR